MGDGVVPVMPGHGSEGAVAATATAAGTTATATTAAGVSIGTKIIIATVLTAAVIAGVTTTSVIVTRNKNNNNDDVDSVTTVATTPWPSSMPSLTEPSPSPIEECREDADTETGQVALYLEGLTRPLNETETGWVENAFLNVYNDLSGGCDDLFERFLINASIVNQTVDSGPNNSSYLQTEWLAEVECRGCPKNNALFADSSVGRARTRRLQIDIGNGTLISFAEFIQALNSNLSKLELENYVRIVFAAVYGADNTDGKTDCEFSFVVTIDEARDESGGSVAMTVSLDLTNADVEDDSNACGSGFGDCYTYNEELGVSNLFWQWLADFTDGIANRVVPPVLGDDINVTVTAKENIDTWRVVSTDIFGNVGNIDLSFDYQLILRRTQC